MYPVFGSQAMSIGIACEPDEGSHRCSSEKVEPPSRLRRTAQYETVDLPAFIFTVFPTVRTAGGYEAFPGKAQMRGLTIMPTVGTSSTVVKPPDDCRFFRRTIQRQPDPSLA